MFGHPSVIQHNFDELEMRATISLYFKYNTIDNILRYTESADNSELNWSKSTRKSQDIANVYLCLDILYINQDERENYKYC
jgi:hypothetical protein